MSHQLSSSPVLATSLNTKRCKLRPVEHGDLALIEEGVSHPRFPTNLPLSALYREGRLPQWLDRMCEMNGTPQSAVWAIDLHTGSRSLGQVALIAGEGKHSLSFWLSPTYWDLGLAREAVAAVVAHFTTTVGARPIWAGAAVWNEPSARPLLALGFSEDTLIEDGYAVDGQSFAVRQFWLAARAPL